MCGDKSCKTLSVYSSKGSPPRVRGQVVIPPVNYPVTRITPACAGTRYLESVCVPMYEDHPRVCGDKATAPEAAPIAVGSPPRVRGQAFTMCFIASSMGITPACAGTSISHDPARRLHGDHPRVCGDKLKRRFLRLSLRGSPPRVRGQAHLAMVSRS